MRSGISASGRLVWKLQMQDESVGEGKIADYVLRELMRVEKVAEMLEAGMTVREEGGERRILSVGEPGKMLLYELKPKMEMSADGGVVMRRGEEGMRRLVGQPSAKSSISLPCGH